MSDNSNTDPMQFLLKFQMHMMKIHDALAGYNSVLKYNDKGEAYFEAERDPETEPICTLEGAKYLVHHIEMFMNQHTAFSDMSSDDIATLPGDAVKQPVDMMIAWPNKYLVGKTDDYGHTTYPYAQLQTEGYALYDMLYMYFTALRNAGIKDFAINTIMVRYVPVQNTAPQDSSASLYGRGGGPFRK